MWSGCCPLAARATVNPPPLGTGAAGLLLIPATHALLSLGLLSIRAPFIGPLERFLLPYFLTLPSPSSLSRSLISPPHPAWLAINLSVCLVLSCTLICKSSALSVFSFFFSSLLYIPGAIIYKTFPPNSSRHRSPHQHPLSRPPPLPLHLSSILTPTPSCQHRSQCRPLPTNRGEQVIQPSSRYSGCASCNHLTRPIKPQRPLPPVSPDQ